MYSRWLNYYSYSVVYKCWKVDPDERPCFETLSLTFDEKLQAVAGYLELKMVLESQGRKKFGYQAIMSFVTTGGDGYETMVTEMVQNSAYDIKTVDN